VTGAKKKKIVGLSCGRKNGNSEVLLKEALMVAEEQGVETEIIRAHELRVKPCLGCQACTMAMSKGKDIRCAIKDDDVPWILEKTMVEDYALIVSFPVYHLRANGYLMSIYDRMLPTMLNNRWMLKKERVGAIISVGGQKCSWTSLALSTANIFVQMSRFLVDQMQVINVNPKGAILVEDKELERARELGRRVVKAMSMPIEEVKYMGDDKDVSCPVCHCNVLSVPQRLPEVYCPVCWVKGVVTLDGDKMKVKWDEKSAKRPRFSEFGQEETLQEIKVMQMKFFQEDIEKAKKLEKKYLGWGNFVKP
jgi:multimeric flavodoxin WrbA